MLTPRWARAGRALGLGGRRRGAASVHVEVDTGLVEGRQPGARPGVAHDVEEAQGRRADVEHARLSTIRFFFLKTDDALWDAGERLLPTRILRSVFCCPSPKPRSSRLASVRCSWEGLRRGRLVGGCWEAGLSVAEGVTS